MAKKVVATLKKKDAKGFAKVVKAVKSAKTGAYTCLLYTSPSPRDA